MGTKNNPDEFDCHHKARTDEPLFTLLARDELAPLVVEYWAALAQDNGERVEKVRRARDCAHEMRRWRQENFDEPKTG